MIIESPYESLYDMFDQGVCPRVSVDHPNLTRHRTSPLLGPDGENIIIGYRPNKLGFDLTPTKK